jgi:hypothetical protein
MGRAVCAGFGDAEYVLTLLAVKHKLSNAALDEFIRYMRRAHLQLVLSLKPNATEEEVRKSLASTPPLARTLLGRARTVQQEMVRALTHRGTGDAALICGHVVSLVVGGLTQGGTLFERREVSVDLATLPFKPARTETLTFSVSSMRGAIMAQLLDERVGGEGGGVIFWTTDRAQAPAVNALPVVWRRRSVVQSAMDWPARAVCTQRGVLQLRVHAPDGERISDSRRGSVCPSQLVQRPLCC